MSLFASLTYIVAHFAYYLVVALQICMFVRALMSWFMPNEDSPLPRFIYAVTEPFIYPVRVLLDRFNLFSGFPFDMAYLITVILLSILEFALGVA